MFIWIAGAMLLASMVATLVLWGALRAAQQSIELEPTLYESSKPVEQPVDADDAFDTHSPAVAALTFRWQQ